MEYNINLEFSVKQYILLKQLLKIPVAYFQDLIDDTTSVELKTLWTKEMEEAQALLNMVKEG